jgi:hypothetical protein
VYGAAGVLQMQAFSGGDCFPSASPSSNSIKALCNVASKVTVTAAGIIKMVPLVQATFNYSGPGFSMEDTSMNCKDLNASGLFNSKTLVQAVCRAPYVRLLDYG